VSRRRGADAHSACARDRGVTPRQGGALVACHAHAAMEHLDGGLRDPHLDHLTDARSYSSVSTRALVLRRGQRRSRTVLCWGRTKGVSLTAESTTPRSRTLGSVSLTGGTALTRQLRDTRSRNSGGEDVKAIVDLERSYSGLDLRREPKPVEKLACRSRFDS
jgi:hypothetical protein